MLLQLKQINKGYGQRGTSGFRPVLEGLSLNLNKGERIAVVGRSGSGKSTLLNIMGAIDLPDQGEVIFEGTSLTSLNANQLADFRNRKIGFVFQLHHLLPQLTLWENVLLPILAQRKITDEDKQWAEFLVRKVGVWEQRTQKPSELSGGECQRAAVVRALINKPSLLLADEPTGALDEENAGILSDLLVKISKEQGLTLVVVTHSLMLAGKMDRRLLLKQGILWEEEQVPEVRI